jgi:hypothetical protein
VHTVQGLVECPCPRRGGGQGVREGLSKVWRQAARWKNKVGLDLKTKTIKIKDTPFKGRRPRVW